MAPEVIPLAGTDSGDPRSGYRAAVPPAPVLIRPPTPDDAERIAAVHTRSWQALGGVLDPGYLAGLDLAASAARWRSKLADPNPPTRDLVAEVDGLVVGLASYGRSFDPDAPWTGPSTLGELQHLYVDPAHWSAGIGAALYDAALTALAADGFATGRLWVIRGNDRAIGFYCRRGWRPDTLLRHEGEDPTGWTEQRYLLPDLAERFGPRP